MCALANWQNAHDQRDLAHLIAMSKAADNLHPTTGFADYLAHSAYVFATQT